MNRSPNIIRAIKIKNYEIGNRVQEAETRNTYSVLMVKAERRRPSRRPMRIYENNIKMDLKEINEREWNGPIWLRTRTNGGVL
jgi:uncharacterized protein YqeY